jgi:glyoxylase-like metal-dependent hydrolase (beta-lactamase superfamily II)
VLPGVYLVFGFPWGRHPNAYAVDCGQGEIAMVDAGQDPGDLEHAFGVVREWGLDPECVRVLLLTHAHFDHAGNAHLLADRGVRVVAGRPDAEAVEAGDERTIGYAVHRTFVPTAVTRKLADGDSVKVGGLEFGSILVPGHTEGCVVYTLELGGRRVMFTGDVVQVGPECGSANLGWTGGPDYDRAKYLASLRRLAGEPCDVVLGGHGEPCLADGKTVLEMAYTRAMLEWR